MLAKKHLIGLRENAIQCIADMGLMQHSVQVDQENDVLPWLLEKMDDFIDNEQIVDENAEEVADIGIFSVQGRHAETLKRVHDMKAAE